MILIEGLEDCSPCRRLHKELERECIDHVYRIVDGRGGVCYPHVIVNGKELEPMTVEEYVRYLRDVH